MAQKYLVLGSSSFYGSTFANMVESRGHTAIRLQRPAWNIGNPLPDQDFDYVVNFVSQSLVVESWADPYTWLAVNAVSTTALLEELRGRKFKKFIHVSTPEVYGDTDGWVDENHGPWKPSTPYAVSRAAGDHMLMAYHRAYGLPAVITRTANIYGKGQPAHRLIPLAIETLRSGEKLLLHGGGHTIRAWIHVKDACEALYRLCGHGSVGRTYHISTQQEYTVGAVVRKICKLLGKHYDNCVGRQEERLGKDHCYLLKSDMLRNIGWKDSYTLDRGLQELCIAN